MVVLRDKISGKYAIERQDKWYSHFLDWLWPKRQLYAVVFDIFVYANKLIGNVTEEDLDI